MKDKPNKWAGTKTWGCLTKREVDGTLTPKGRKTIQKFGARTNVWHYGTVLPMESELFGGKAVSLRRWPWPCWTLPCGTSAGLP